MEKKLKYIFIFNSIILLSLLTLVELFLGNWKYFNSPVTKIPAAPFSRKKKRDVSKIYGLANSYYISNIRDKNGYRFSQDYNTKNIILTIGGSTTAQKNVDEKYTWQNIISKKLDDNFAVLNGGVSGQTSFGHLYSIENWHSKSLPIEKIKLIIYYFGINDIRLLESVPKIEDYRATAYANDKFWKIKSFLSKYSFFYSRSKELINIYFPKEMDNKSFFAYKEKTKRFKNKGKINQLKIIDYDSKFDYLNLIKNLSKKTNDLFPNAKVFFVQQPIPGCKFINTKTFENKYINKTNICSKLAEVFLLQDYALKNELNLNNKVIKMYLDNPLSKEGTYDEMHANEYGSLEIGQYLYGKIFKNKDF